MIVTTLLAISVVAQGPRTLSDAVKALNWKPEAGALIVLDPDSVRATDKGQGLAAFERKQIALGSLTAIVPTEMVVVDDSFKQQPSLTDGLSREAKMLYLIQTLTSSQWQTATGKNGIGMNDLQGEQRAIFESIMPKPFSWASYRVNKNRIAEGKEGGATLSDEQTSKVRIRIGRRLSFGVELLHSTGYTLHGPEEEYGEPGDLALVRDDETELKNPRSFGLLVTQAVNNKTKNSELAYTDQTIVALPSSGTVKEILSAVGKATGQELHADIRIADRKATILGTKAKAGDVLQALALCVTGTYRKVGSAYILTSDLIGLGARKLRFHLWWEALMQASYARQDEWRKAIGERVDSIPVDPDGKFKLTDAMQKHIAKQDSYPAQEWLDASEVSPELRRYLENMNKRWAHQPLKTEKVRIQSNLDYGFVLPDGRPLKPERSVLGQTWTFHPRFPTGNRSERPSIPLPFESPAAGFVSPIAVRVDTPAEATAAIAEVVAHGFRDVWLETRNPNALKAALEAAKPANLTLRLLVRPWQASGRAPTDQDRTILGDGGAQLQKSFEESDAWKRLGARARMTPFGYYDRISPLDPALPAAWTAIEALAATPGLAGTVLIETEPPGYEPRFDLATYGGFTQGLVALRQFGYSAGQRLAFLRANGIDPIDIVGERLMAGPDLRQPFFLDDGLRGIPSVYDGSMQPHPALRPLAWKWQEFKAQLNKDAITSLATRLASKNPVSIDVRALTTNFPGVGMPGVTPWTLGTPLPSYAQDSPYEPPRSMEMTGLLRLQERTTLRPDSIIMIRSLLDSPTPQRGVIDATLVPSKTFVETLDYWFKRR